MVIAVPFMLVFRFLHILAGVLWVGSAFLFVGFIGPSAAEVAPTAVPLLHTLVKKRKIPKIITGLGGTTVIAGWILWIRDMRLAGLGDWVSSRFGLVLTIGAILATIAWIEGVLGVGQNVERLADLGDQAAAAGGPPSPELQAKLEHVGSELARWGKIDLVLLVLAVIAMATARYW